MTEPSPQKAEPGNGHKTIWVFTPSRTDPKDLEFIFVQRHKLLQDAVDRVRESAITDHKHHLLFVGPRGCGKTHLITLIVSRLGDDAALADRLRIAWLNEDETCTALLELFVKIHSALEKRHPEEYRGEMLSAAYDMEQDAALEFVSKHLLARLGSRTLLVVAENLDAIFDGLGDSGQKRLRAFIQENPRISIVATAQRLVKDFSDRTSPFFGFFQTEHLGPLNVKEATELLQNIARLQGKGSVVEFLSTGRGRSRVRALHHLSGGNHRIYIVLSQFITRDSIDALLEPFMKMVDELTPYYQERIRWLPPLQRRIVEYLCGCEGTVPVKEIAKRLFATPQTISSALQDLREKGYVEANQRGRESLYEICEPLMRISVEVKDTQHRQPLRLLVDFLRVWYDDRELKDRLGQMKPAASSCAYLESAILRNRLEGNLRKQLFLEDFHRSLPEELAPELRDGLIRELSTRPEGVILAMESLAAGNKAEAIRCLDEAIAQEPDSSDKAYLLLSRAGVHSEVGDRGKEIDDYTTLIGLSGAPTEQVAQALFNRALAYRQAGETQREVDDYTTLIGLSGAPVEQVAEALFYRGVTYRQAGETQRGIDDYTAVIALPGAPVAEVATALYLRAIAFLQQSRKQESQSDFETLIRLQGAPVELVVDSYVALSELNFGAGKWSEGFQALETGLERGAKGKPPYHGTVIDLIGVVFSAGLSPEGRREKVSDLVAIYNKYRALPALGEAVVKHIGGVFRAGEPFPSADNLEGWASAWEEAAEGMAEFRLAVRLLRTGIAFIKAGGKDPGALLNVTSTERALLRQALGLAEKEQARSI